MTSSRPELGANKTRRQITLVVVGLALLAVVLLLAFGCGDDRSKAAATQYSKDWARQDFAAMYKQLSPQAKSAITLDQFVEAQRNGLATATVRQLKAGKASEADNGIVTVPFTVETRAFGTLHLNARIPVQENGDNMQIGWDRSMVLPGLAPGESLTSQTTMPPRASILAADGTPLAEGPYRSSPIPETASEIAGQVGTPGPGIAMTMAANGYPTGTKVGLTGLERIFQERLAGRPGGTLKAGSRVLARSTAKAMPALRTTIVPSIERAAASALGGRYGGIAALDPKTGAVLALAGTAFSETGPPGSTFKIITASAGLEANAVSLSSSFPIETQTTIGGRALHNANDESCGGTLTESFAESCNSVFAPLGVKVGARKLVSMAERYGFNKPMRNIPRAAISSIPKASEMNEEDLGTAAIGQGQVVASPLEMGTVAATIANSGVRVEPTLAIGERAITNRAVSAKIASQIRGLMLAVVNQGTGTSAAITGVKVAGKTGTAEVRDASSPNYVAGDPSNTDAWFVAFAPAYAPRIAVGVLINGAGAGGETAAPAARDVLLAGLQSTGG